MKRETKRRFEELFSAEHLLRRVYLHLMQKERSDISALGLVVIRHEAITYEQRKLKRRAASERL